MIEINNLTKFKIDEKSFSQVAKKVLKGENRRTETLSLVFVNEQEIKKLNKKFRGKNKATDVLSFELSGRGGPALGGKNKYLGEVVVCPQVIKKNSEKDKKNFEKELLKVFIHGVLHLLGYDHEESEKNEKIMNKKQEKYLE
jgi:probable rRNA maturation factor